MNLKLVILPMLFVSVFSQAEIKSDPKSPQEVFAAGLASLTPNGYRPDRSFAVHVQGSISPFANDPYQWLFLMNLARPIFLSWWGEAERQRLIEPLLKTLDAFNQEFRITGAEDFAEAWAFYPVALGVLEAALRSSRLLMDVAHRDEVGSLLDIISRVRRDGLSSEYAWKLQDLKAHHEKFEAMWDYCLKQPFLKSRGEVQRAAFHHFYPAKD